MTPDDTLRAALEQPEQSITPNELAAALGWPGGVSDPVLDKVELLRMVALKERSTLSDAVAEAAAELRRLHAVNGELLTALKVLLNNNEALTGENIARAAIAKAEGK